MWRPESANFVSMEHGAFWLHCNGGSCGTVRNGLQGRLQGHDCVGVWGNIYGAYSYRSSYVCTVCTYIRTHSFQRGGLMSDCVFCDIYPRDFSEDHEEMSVFDCKCQGCARLHYAVRDWLISYWTPNGLSCSSRLIYLYDPSANFLRGIRSICSFSCPC